MDTCNTRTRHGYGYGLGHRLHYIERAGIDRAAAANLSLSMPIRERAKTIAQLLSTVWSSLVLPISESG